MTREHGIFFQLVEEPNIRELLIIIKEASTNEVINELLTNDKSFEKIPTHFNEPLMLWWSHLKNVMSCFFYILLHKSYSSIYIFSLKLSFLFVYLHFS